MENPVCKSLEFSSFMLEPMQRITRYPLLLKQILHYTATTHPDHPFLIQALCLTETLLTLVNDSVKASEDLAKLEEIQSVIELDQIGRLDLTGTTRSLGRRTFIHEVGSLDDFTFSCAHSPIYFSPPPHRPLTHTILL